MAYLIQWKSTLCTFALLTLVFLTLFILFPTLVLALYPFKFFQKFLSILPICWHFLYAFVDSFQGCYKDGTEPGTVDCRLFAQFGLFFRLAFFVIYALTLNSMFFVYAAIAITLYMVDTSDECKSFQDRHIFLPINRLCVFCAYQFLLHSILGIEIASMEGHVYLPVIHVLATLSPFTTIIYVLYINYTPLGVHTEKMWQTVMILWK